MPPPDDAYSRSRDLNTLRQEFYDFRRRREEEVQAYRIDTAEWRKQQKEDVLQFRGEVSEVRKALEVLTRMMGQVEQQTISTKDMAIREQKQMEQVYFLLRGDNEGRGGILGRSAAFEFQTKQLEIRREEIVKNVHDRLGELEQNREKVSARVWQIAISALTGSVGALALSRLFAP